MSQVQSLDGAFSEATATAGQSRPLSQAAMLKMYSGKPLSLVQLQEEELELYANVLSHYGDHDRSQELITTLPQHLLNPTPGCFSQQKLCRMFNDAGADVPIPATLCRHHAKLNAQLVQDAYDMISAEVEDNLAELVEEQIGGYRRIPERLRHRIIDEAHAFLAAILDADEFEYWFKRRAPKLWLDCRGMPPCCLLSKVGSSPQLLCALRACITARLPDDFLLGKRKSVRLYLVDGWIRTLEPNMAIDIVHRSSAAATQLRGLRNDLQVDADDTDDITGSTVFMPSLDTPLCSPRLSFRVSPYPSGFDVPAIPPLHVVKKKQAADGLSTDFSSNSRASSPPRRKLSAQAQGLVHGLSHIAYFNRIKRRWSVKYC